MAIFFCFYGVDDFFFVFLQTYFIRRTIIREIICIMKKIVICFLLSLLLSVVTTGCKPTEKEVPTVSTAANDTLSRLVMQIQKCSRLYTTEFQVHKIVTYDDVINLKGSLLNQKYSFRMPFGDRKVAIPMNATLKAYIDFGEFSEASVERHGRKLTITLPNPRVVMTASKIDQQNIREYVSLTRAHFSDRELADLELQGREAILQSIPQMGIIDHARMSAAKLLIPIAAQMGFGEDDIVIVFPDSFDPNNLKAIIDTD